jgi:hypothetical protein
MTIPIIGMPGIRATRAAFARHAGNAAKRFDVSFGWGTDTEDTGGTPARGGGGDG